MKLNPLTGLLVSAIALSLCPGLGTLASSRAMEQTNEAIGRLPATMSVTDPVAYYTKRQQALNLALEERWSDAATLLRQLTTQYSDDGDTWYLLGLACLQTHQWREAIFALQQTINLGTTLYGIPSGSVPSNDNMVRIAQAHAQLGEQIQAIAWLEKALAARWDERHSLIGHDGFANMADSEEFKRISGAAVADLGRDQAWRADLNFLVESIERLHVDMYHAIAPIEFQLKVAALQQEIPALSDQQIMVEFMRLLGALGNGHNFVLPVYSLKGALLQLPIQFYWFSDGLFVVAAEEGFQQWVGSKVELIGSTPVAEAAAWTMQFNARDNEMQHLLLSPFYLALPAVLKRLDIVDNAGEVSLTVMKSNGSKSTVTLTPRAFDFRGFPTLPLPKSAHQLLYLSRINEFYWFQKLPEVSAIFVQFNLVAHKDGQSLKQFNEALRAQIAEREVDTLILDLRYNSGGNGSILPPMLRTLIYFETTRPDGQLFVIMGRKKFSAGHALLAQISELTNAVLVGEPSGSRPNARSESGWFVLPHSGIRGIVSSQYHQPSAPEDHRIWIAPHVPILLSADQYFGGKDPALDAILSISGRKP